MTSDDTVTQLWLNPDFRHVVVFFGLHSISFQTKDKEKKKRFFETLKKDLQEEAPNMAAWPYSQPIMIAIFICGPSKNYSRQDVDNMTKLILDACSGIVYNDDRQVEILLVQKRIWDKSSYGFQFGIRLPDTSTFDLYTPVLWYNMDKPENTFDHDCTFSLFDYSHE